MPYEYPTNYSNGTQVTGPGGMFLDYPTSIVSEYSGGIMILIFLATFALGSLAGVKRGLMSSLFITGIISVYFAARGWINMIVPFGFGVVLVIVIIVALLEGKGGSF